MGCRQRWMAQQRDRPPCQEETGAPSGQRERGGWEGLCVPILESYATLGVRWQSTAELHRIDGGDSARAPRPACAALCQLRQLRRPRAAAARCHCHGVLRLLLAAPPPPWVAVFATDLLSPKHISVEQASAWPAQPAQPASLVSARGP